jgi:hypothetical protein
MIFADIPRIKIYENQVNSIIFAIFWRLEFDLCDFFQLTNQRFLLVKQRLSHR